MQEAGVAAIRGLKVFFSDKQEKGLFSEASVQVSSQQPTILPLLWDVNASSLYANCKLSVKIEVCLLDWDWRCVQEDAAHAERFRAWLAKHQSSFHARLRRLLKDGAAPEMQVLHSPQWPSNFAAAHGT